MKKYVIIALVILAAVAFLIVPLFGNKITERATFAFKDNIAVPIGSSAKLEILPGQGIEKIELRLGNDVIKTWEDVSGNVAYNLETKNMNLGAKQLIVRSFYGEDDFDNDRRMLRIVSDIKPTRLTAVIEKEYPHDPRNFTQGLEFYKGKLFEGTGDPGHTGQTKIGEIDLETGTFKNDQFISLDANYFGEGITILNDKLYQLTWQKGKCFVYDVNALDQISISEEFTYLGEGWGLCNNGVSLIMSDGSEHITFRNPETFEIEKTLNVYNHLGPIVSLNELEWINGRIYANIWQGDEIIVIDPTSGKVLERIDAIDIVINGRGNGEVLNGIAYQAEENKLYLTGKNWPSLFEVSVQ
ncbi:MAG: glutaminyl-peptide cyclotransferase [Crocinitomicaceae bacterium]|nr:glutaminyl-peptide cyclotransferase [Crocinitomicaceae bacterium]